MARLQTNSTRAKTLELHIAQRVATELEKIKNHESTALEAIRKKIADGEETLASSSISPKDLFPSSHSDEEAQRKAQTSAKVQQEIEKLKQTLGQRKVLKELPQEVESAYVFPPTTQFLYESLECSEREEKNGEVDIVLTPTVHHLQETRRDFVSADKRPKTARLLEGSGAFQEGSAENGRELCLLRALSDRLEFECMKAVSAFSFGTTESESFQLLRMRGESPRQCIYIINWERNGNAKRDDRKRKDFNLRRCTSSVSFLSANCALNLY